MYAKIHHFDISSCLHLLNSTKTFPNLGVSLNPKHNIQPRTKQTTDYVRIPDGKTTTNKQCPLEFSQKTSENGVLSKIEKEKIDEKMGDLDTLFDVKKNPDDEILKTDEVVEGEYCLSVKKVMQTTCSTKWVKYGGCIPAILEALESVSDLDEAFRPWEKGLSNKERSIILKEQVDWEKAMKIFDWFKRKGCYELNVIHYNIMIKILGKARRFEVIEDLCKEMKERGIEPINSTYGTLIDVYSKGGRKEEAIRWLELMNEKGMEPDEVTMGIVVQMYKKAREFDKAEQFFKKWSVEKSVTTNKLKGKGCNGDSGVCSSLSSHTYNNLIDTYGKSGQLNEACKTFESMLREKIVPTTVTFNTMIHMCGNNGRIEEVGFFMQKMKELQCFPDTRTYNILIFLHAKHNNIKMAATYFKEMKEASLEPDLVSYRTLLYAYSLRLMVDEAEELTSEMDERGLQVDEFTQSALTRMYIEAGLLKKAWLWFERFHLAGNMSSECYSANIDAFGERGYVLEAEEVFRCCLKRGNLCVLEFNVMIKAYGISKKFDEACCLFDSMERHGVLPDRCTYNSLIQMLAGADLPHKAKPYVRKMQEAGLVDDCVPYCAVISGFVKLCKLDKAVCLFKEMIRLGIKPDVVVYGVLINAFADTGNAKHATEYLGAMTKAGLPVNEVIHNSLLKLYTKVGYLKEAQVTYRILQSSEAGPDVYSSNCMIDLYSERSMVKRAEEIFSNLKGAGKANEFAYAMMLCMYKRNGMFREAVRLAKQMREFGLLTDVLSYNTVLNLYAKDGRFRDAAATFKEMLVSAIQPDDSTFRSLGIVLMKCGVPREAVKKLELTRTKEFEAGLQAWTNTLRSVIDMG